MTEPIELTITLDDGTATTHQLTEVTTIGRSECDIVIAVPGISRQHATLAQHGEAWAITDLDSSNGTFVNGDRIAEPTWITPNDVVRLGATVTLTIGGDIARSATTSAPPQVVATMAEQVAPGAHGVSAAPAAAEVADGIEVLARDGVEVRFIKKSAGRKVAKAMLDSARRARKKLAGFGTEADHPPVTIHLIDPFVRDAMLVTSGSVIDAASSQLWCVVSSDAKPEDPTRAMALIFGAQFPAMETLEPLIAGYGLQLAGHHDAPPGDWDGLAEPARTQTAAAFVHHMIEKSDDESVRAWLASPPDAVNSNARELFGQPVPNLVRSWIAADSSDYKSGQFARLAFKRLWPYRVRQVEVFIYMLFSLAFSSVYPFVTRRLFDDVIPSGEFGRVWRLLLVLFVAFIISLVAGVRRAYQSSFISASVVRDLRQEMFDRIQRLSSSSLSGYQQGELLSRMFQDVGMLQSGLSAMINTGIFQFVSLIVSGAIMLSVNLWLGLLVAAGAPVIAFVYHRMGEGAQKRSIELQEDHAALVSVAAENYQAGSVVKVFQLEEREGNRFGQAATKLIKSTQSMSLFNGYFGLSVNFIVTLLQMVVLGLGAWLIFQGNFTLGGLVAFLGVMGEFLGPVTDLTTLGQTMQQSMGSLKRIEEVTEAGIEPAGEDLGDLAPMASSIELRNLSFSYTPERRTLDGLNVTIPAGTRAAFVGPSGSGKSTVLQVLMRLIEPDEGTLAVDGIDVRERSLSSLRSQIGVVFQDPFLFDVSLADNIALGADNPTREQIEAAAEAAEISSFVDQLPEGLNSPVGEGGSFLSGGQRQRAAIARALVGNPSVLILDEATSALDAATERQINDTLDRAVEGRTVVSVTHRLTAITDYEQIVVLVDGAVESQGTHAELLAEGGTYARLWSEQTGAPMPEPEHFDAVAALMDLSPFRDAGPAVLEAMIAAATIVRLDTGSTMIAPPHGLALLKSGRATLLNVSGDVHDATSGDALGLSGLLATQLDETVLTATEPIVVLSFDAAAINDCLRTVRREIGDVPRDATLILPKTSKTLTRATLSMPLATAAAEARTADIRGTIQLPLDSVR